MVQILVSVQLNGSLIRRQSDIPITNALVELPTTDIMLLPSKIGTEQCLDSRTAGERSRIVIDLSPIPKVINITTSTWSDVYGVNEWVDFYVSFNIPVLVEEKTRLFFLYWK